MYNIKYILFIIGKYHIYFIYKFLHRNLLSPILYMYSVYMECFQTRGGSEFPGKLDQAIWMDSRMAAGTAYTFWECRNI